MRATILWTLAQVADGHHKASVPVEVWHADPAELRDAAFRGPSAMERRRRVYACVANASQPDDAILAIAFHEFNVGDDPTFGEPSAVGVEYRDALRVEQNGYGTRSLSVGDEVRIDGRRYLCASAGWIRVDSAAPIYETLREIEESPR